MLELQELKKDFEGVRAVDSLSLSLKRGGIFGLLGPNGAGKSTTIRMILQIIMADSGKILFDGRPITSADRERIGYLPEERGLYPKMKCGETLEYFARLKSVEPGEDLNRRIDYWLERFQLSEYKNRKVDDLSKGMGQKLQFIVTLLHNPDLLILDEPFSGLDPLSQNLILEILSDLKRDGKTILFSTHIMDHAEKICDEITIINRGTQILSGRLSDIKSSRGNNTLYLESEQDFPRLEDIPGVQSVLSFPRGREVMLEQGNDGQQLLKTLLDQMALQRFEFKAPSLHAIYSELLGADHEKQ